MNAFYLILAASPIILLAVVAFLILVVAGIRRGDQNDLASPPATRLDAIARRVTGVGIRNNPPHEYEEK